MSALSTEVRERLRGALQGLSCEAQQEALFVAQQVHDQKNSRWAFICNLLGLERLRVEHGRVHCELPVSLRLHNRLGVLHGGAIFTLVDYTMFRSTLSLIDPARGERCTTVELKINYVSPGSGGKVIVDTKVVNAGKRIFVLESRVTGEDGALIALATGSYYVSRPAENKG